MTAINTSNEINKDQLMTSFPFGSTLSFGPLLQYLRTRVKDKTKSDHILIEKILEAVNDAPVLEKPIRDFAVLEKHKSAVDLLMYSVVPPADDKRSMVAVSKPFDFESIHTTQRFIEVMCPGGKVAQYEINTGNKSVLLTKFFHACTAILAKFYGVEIKLETPFIFKIPDPETKLDRYFKANINTTFTDIKKKKKLKPLSESDIQNLKDNFYDFDLWKHYILPENFEFQGFVILSLVDVTMQEVLSHFKHDLLEKDAIISEQRINHLQNDLRSLFKLPDLRLGFAGFNERANSVINRNQQIWRSFLWGAQSDISCEDLMGSLYEKTILSGMPIIIENIEEEKSFF
jgi:hypothetical protein